MLLVIRPLLPAIVVPNGLAESEFSDAMEEASDAGVMVDGVAGDEMAGVPG